MVVVVVVCVVTVVVTDAGFFCAAAETDFLLSADATIDAAAITVAAAIAFLI